MAENDNTRKLVKTRLLPPLHAELTDYASHTHRSISSAAEHLIARGLDAERTTDREDPR